MGRAASAALSSVFHDSSSRLIYRPFEQRDMPCIQQTWQSNAPDCYSNSVFVADNGEKIVGFVLGRCGHGKDAHIFQISEPVIIAAYNLVIIPSDDNRQRDKNKKDKETALKMAFLEWVSRNFPDMTHYREGGFFAPEIPIPRPPPKKEARTSDRYLPLSSREEAQRPLEPAGF